MKIYNLSEYVKGWMFGDFTPSLLDTTNFEIGVKEYCAGDTELRHYHAIAKEWTIIVYGFAYINGELFGENQIIEIEPNESVLFKALSKVKTVVVKVPSVKGDKYLV